MSGETGCASAQHHSRYSHHGARLRVSTRFAHINRRLVCAFLIGRANRYQNSLTIRSFHNAHISCGLSVSPLSPFRITHSENRRNAYLISIYDLLRILLGGRIGNRTHLGLIHNRSTDKRQQHANIVNMLVHTTYAVHT